MKKKTTAVIISLSVGMLQADCLAGEVKKIICEGNIRISTQTIESYLGIEPGDTITSSGVDESVKRLFRTGFFSDVAVFEENGVLKVRVLENPLTYKIAFDGNKRIEDTDLLKEIASKENSVLSLHKVQRDVARIIDLYRKVGRYATTVEPKIIKLDQNRVNLIFEIHEGKEAVIKKINFVGNGSFSSTDLSDAILSRESRWYRFFSNADVYDPDKLEVDKEYLSRFYMNKGYADFKVVSSVAELSPSHDGFLLTFVIEEGIKYYVGNVEAYSNVPEVKPEDLQHLFKIGSGDLFSMEQVDETVDAIIDYFGNRGYPFVDVEPDIKTHPDSMLADVQFEIKPTQKMYLRHINIKNNTRTLDKVIRREFRILEGDPYNVAKLHRSKQRIENLGFFGKQEFKNKKTEHPDQMDLEIIVEEKATGSLNFAGGYNTASGMVGHITLSENNFLGKGQQVQLGGSLGKKEKGGNFSFTEPYFMGYDLSAGFDLFANRKDMISTSSFNSTEAGFAVRFGYNLTEHLSHSVKYVLKKEVVKDIAPDASIYVRENKGRKIISSVGHTLSYNKLDSNISPTSGYLVSLDQDLAGFGGSVKYLSTTAKALFLYPIYKTDIIFKTVARAGYVSGFGGKTVGINDRFYIGQDYIRGFSSIGPVDKSTKDFLGGKIYGTLTTEFTFPLGLPSELGIRGGVFNDIGTLYGVDLKTSSKENLINKNALRATAGVSLLWKSPFGSFGVHYGIPYKKEKLDAVQKLYIDMGTTF